MLDFRRNTTQNAVKYLVFKSDKFDSICLGEISIEFPGEHFSFKTNKYLFQDELQEILNKLKELNENQ